MPLNLVPIVSVDIATAKLALVFLILLLIAVRLCWEVIALAIVTVLTADVNCVTTPVIAL